MATEAAAAPAVETAVKTAPVLPASESKELKDFTDKQYDHWRLTGETPEEAPKESSGTKAGEKEPPAKSESAAATEAEATREHKEVKPGKMGYGELRARVKQLEEELAGKAAPKPVRVEEPKVEKREKSEPRPRPEDTNTDGTPKYKDWNEYEDARDSWIRREALVEFREAQQKEQREATVTQQNRQIEQSWKKRVDEATGKHADFAEVALDPDKGPGKLIGKGSVVDAWILDSDMGAEILYHFGQNRSDLERYADLNPIQAARELAKLEARLSGEPSKEAPKIEIVKTTKAPPPAREVGGRGTAAVDDVQKAVADDDVSAYIAAQNRREIAARGK